MSKPEQLENIAAVGGLREQLTAFVDAVVAHHESAADDFEDLLADARQLLHQQLADSSAKHATRALLEKLLTEHLREALPAEADPEGRAGAVGASLVAGSVLADFATAIDRAMLESRTPRDYSFAGRADFISLEEVLQLLGGASHRGCLALEKSDNQLDVYLDNSSIVFLDPHRFIRRVLPSPDRMSYREIPSEALAKAEARHAGEGLPIVMTLAEEGVFREQELANVARALGLEVLYQFLRDQTDCAYTYRRLNELPPFAVSIASKLPVTPVLLEGNKRLDDWRSLSRVFPDPDAPLRPVENMFAKISSLDLSVLEIKLLAQINDQVSPNKLAPAMGLPLQDIYHYLVRFAKEGVLLPPGGDGMLDEVAISIEESVEIAIQALDANDDHTAVSNALDKVLGDGDGFL